MVLSKTTGVYFELSNRCNLANVHKLCPLSTTKSSDTLPMQIVKDALEFMEEQKYEGKIAFHNYNEPMMDPRLFHLIALARWRCPNSEIFILTNGIGLNDTMIQDLRDDGVNTLQISAYSDKEYAFLKDIKVPQSIEYICRRVRGLDARMQVYYRTDGVGCKNPCFAPLNYVLIHCTGEVGLCCMDYKRTQTFGDLNVQSLQEVLETPKMREVYDRLSVGDRYLKVCQGCTNSR